MQKKFPREIRDMVYGYVLKDLEPFAKWAPYTYLARRVSLMRGPSTYTDRLDHLRRPLLSTLQTRLELNEAWWNTTFLSLRNLDFLDSPFYAATCPWSCTVFPSQQIKHAIVYIGKSDLTVAGDSYNAPTRALRAITGIPHGCFFDPQESGSFSAGAQLRKLLQLQHGAQVTLWIDYDEWVSPASKTEIIGACIFPIVNELKAAGLRVQRTLPGMFSREPTMVEMDMRILRFLGKGSRYTVGMIGENVEFSPDGWYRFACAYLWAQRETRRILQDAECRR